MNYKKVYDNIILKAQRENRVKQSSIYYEAHHIVPECMGGEGKTTQWKNHPNIILLTAKEHFVCHRLLCKIHPTEDKLIYAFWRMSNQKNQHQKSRHTPSGRAYSEARELYSKVVSNAMKDRIVSKETRLKRSAATKGKPGKNKGKKLPYASEERKHKQSEAHKVPIIHMETKIIYESRVAAAEAANVCLTTISNRIKAKIYQPVKKVASN